jgi:ABC-2 type transport system permease protein
MWLKFKASTIKETLLLLRDKAGLTMLFIMPMALILIMSLLQESTLNMLAERKTPIIIINHDADTFGISILKGLKNSSYFEVDEQVNGNNPTEEELREMVLDGRYRMGIIIHEGASELLRNRIRYEIQEQFPENEVSLFDSAELFRSDFPKVDIYFDPVTKTAFKQIAMSALREFSYAVEARMIFSIYADLLIDLVDIELKQNDGFRDLVELNQQYATGQKSRIIPNAVQHNVPAWTIFAMFFIVIPLAGNIIKERESGMALRLKTMPGSNLSVIMGKAGVYFVIGIIQAVFMLFIGLYILPLFGMPALKLGSGYIALVLITIAVSLAASGYGIVIGTIATSQEQSSIFGSISVVILAAIGGIWVPTFMMSETMNTVSKLSPLNWGLNGYYDIFLRNAGVAEVMPYVLSLLSMFIICILIAWFYNRHKKSYQ